MLSAEIEQPGIMQIVERATPTPVADEVLIKVKASGICGTDVHIYIGEFLAEYPVVPGHEFSGEVVSVGADCSRISPGMRVAVEPNIPCNNCNLCLTGKHHFCTNMVVPGVNRPGGMSEYVLVKEIGVFDIGDLDFKIGAFVEPLSCVLHGVQRLAPKLGDNVLIMGAGPIGRLFGRALSVQGVRKIDFLERNPHRIEAASQEKYGNCLSNFEDIGEFYDVIVDATGVMPLVEKAIDFLVPQGKLLVFGVPGKGAKFSFPAFALLKNEIQIIGSFTSLKDTIPAIDLLKSGVIEVEDLISHSCLLEELESGIKAIHEGKEDRMKTMVCF